MKKKILHDVEKLELIFFSLTSVRDPWIQILHYTEIMTKKLICVGIIPLVLPVLYHSFTHEQRLQIKFSRQNV